MRHSTSFVLSERLCREVSIRSVLIKFNFEINEHGVAHNNNAKSIKSKIQVQNKFSLEVRKIPVDMNTIDKLNGHFSQFGQVTNIQVPF